MPVLLVAAGGALGSMARYLVSSAVSRLWPGFPAGTLVVNLVGCLIAGLVTGYALRDGGTPLSGGLPLTTRLFLIVGFCGGFTTFSAFGLETVTMLRDGHLVLAGLNVASQLTLGFAAVWMGLRFPQFF